MTYHSSEIPFLKKDDSNEETSDLYREIPINEDNTLLVEIACLLNEKESLNTNQAYNVRIRTGIRTTLNTKDKTVDINAKFYQKNNNNR